MQTERSLERSLLNGFEYPVAFVVEVTRQGVMLSKLRYLRALGQLIGDTVQCPNIEVYMHMGNYLDSHLETSGARPPGVHLFYQFSVDKGLFKELLEQISTGKAKISTNNPQTQKLAQGLIRDIQKGKLHNFKKLNPHEQGLILEPYCSMVMEKVGVGKRVILQNVEITDRENTLRIRDTKDETLYYPIALPSMEIDILMIIELENAYSVLKGLERVGFNCKRFC